ncbi:hypothetical protein D9M72_535290 [compost metagenome]
MVAGHLGALRTYGRGAYRIRAVGVALCQCAAMHELREDAATSGVDCIDDAAPGSRLFPVGQAGLSL